MFRRLLEQRFATLVCATLALLTTVLAAILLNLVFSAQASI